MPGFGLQHGERHQPDQFGPGHAGLTGDGIEDNPGANPPRRDEVARDLDGRPDGQAQRPDFRAANGPSHPPGQRQVGSGQPQVVGHQHGTGPHGGGPGGGMGRRWSCVGNQSRPCPPAQLWQRSLRPVQEAGQGQLSARPPGEAVPGLHGATQGAVTEVRSRPGLPAYRPGLPAYRPGLPDYRPGLPAYRPGLTVQVYEGDHVEGPNAGVGTDMPPDIDARHCCPRQRPDTLIDRLRRPGQGEDRAVVVRIAMNVEYAGSGRRRQRRNDLFVPPFTYVDDALEETRCGPGHEFRP